jgi:hypothetical protein
LIPNSVEKECFGVDFSTQNSIDIWALFFI